MTYFGLKSGQDLKNQAAQPHQEFPGVPPRVLTIAFSVNLAVVTLYRARSQMVHFTFYYRKLGKYRLVFFREKDLEQKKKNVRLALVTYRLIGLTTYDAVVMYGMKIILGVRRISTVD